MVNLEDDQPRNDSSDQPTLAPNFFETSDWTTNDLTYLKEVGKGKDTIIYSAICPRLGNHTVAVKVYDRTKVQGNKMRAIKREVAMMKFFQRQKFPNGVEIYGAFQDEARIYIVMEYCSGGDLLERLLRDKRALSERRTAVEVALPLLTVLKRIHEHGIIHRDIKLENIFIDAFGRVKLGDFGLTMSTKQESAISPVGTVEYMAPEVVALPPVDMVSSGRISAASIKPTNEKVDIWALGVTLFELVTGRLPFEGRDKAEVKTNITAYKLTPFPHFISPQCQDMIRSMLAYYPNQRPSAGELLNHPYITTYVAATAAKKGLGNVINLEVKAGTSSPVSPGPPIGMLQPLAVSRSPHFHQVTGGGTSINSQNSQADASTLFNPSEPPLHGNNNHGHDHASNTVHAAAAKAAATLDSNGRPKTAGGAAWAVIKKVSIGHKSKSQRKAQQSPAATDVDDGRSTVSRSRSWSGSGTPDTLHGSNNSIGTMAPVSGGDDNEWSGSKVKRAIKNFFASGGGTGNNTSSGSTKKVDS